MEAQPKEKQGVKVLYIWDKYKYGRKIVINSTAKTWKEDFVKIFKILSPFCKFSIFDGWEGKLQEKASSTGEVEPPL